MDKREELLALIDREFVVPWRERGDPCVIRGATHLYDASNAAELLTFPYPKPITHFGFFGDTMDKLIEQISDHPEEGRFCILELDKLDPNSEYPFAWWAPRRFKYFVRYFTMHDRGLIY